MASPTWRGAVSFGMVAVPVQVFTAVRSRDLRFRQLHRETGQPVKQKRVDAVSGDEVAYDDIVKGYDVGGGRYVTLERDELDDLDPAASRTIEIHDFVEQTEIDPVHYDRAYYLAPDGETAAKPYRLLVTAMERAGRVAIGRFVMRGKEQLAGIRTRDGILVLSTMHYSDEVADPAELDPAAFAVADIDLREREVEMAGALIDAMTTGFCPSCYENEHRSRVLEYLEAKASDELVEVAEEEEPGGGEVIDLMAALESSLARSGRASGTGRTERESEGARPGSTAADLADMTRDQLYTLARERGIPGRSSMTKAELVRALVAAGAHSGAA